MNEIMTKKCILVLFLATCVIMSYGIAQSVNTITIEGTITKKRELIDLQGVVYELVTEKYDDEIAQLIGETVRIKGTLEIQDESRLLTVLSYTVLDSEFRRSNRY